MGQLTFQFPLFIFFIFILNLQNIHCITVDEEECFMPLNVELQFTKELLEHINGKLTLTASQFRQNRMRSSLSSVWTFYAVLLFWVHFLFPEVHVQVSLGKYEKKVIKKKINSWSSKLKTENLARKKKKKDTEVIQSLFISVGMTDGCFSSALWLFPLLWFEFKIFITIFKLQVIVISKHPKSWGTNSQDT